MSHTPVLLQEVLEALKPCSGEFIIDGTVDGGGHAAAIVSRIGQEGTFLGLDWDPGMVKKTGGTFAARYPKLINRTIFFREGNYVDLPKILRQEKLPKANGLLLDLGFSSEQLEDSNRGFSFQASKKDEPLLMTYGDDRESVRDILRRLSEKELADVIFQYGGERRSRQIAKEIKVHGRTNPIRTAGDLADVVRGSLPKNYEHGRIDRATRTFQALRIYANGELENVEKVIDALPEILLPGGRAVIITFHSLEDRIVKHAFQKLSKEKKVELIYKKPIAPTREEIRENPRSRSAKLRAIQLTRIQNTETSIQ